MGHRVRVGSGQGIQGREFWELRKEFLGFIVDS